MSGGSFNYVCYKDADQFISGEGLNDLKELAEFMESRWPDSRATKDTRAFCDRIHAEWVRYNNGDPHLEALKRVWREVEWWQSCDTSEEKAQTAVDSYRPPDSPELLMSWIPHWKDMDFP